MKTYIMERDRKVGTSGAGYITDEDPHTFISLPMRRDLRNHSPDGFEWGYGGSGPSQLALAILCDFFGTDGKRCERAEAIYQTFKWQRIAYERGDYWEYTEAEVENDVFDVMHPQPREQADGR